MRYLISVCVICLNSSDGKSNMQTLAPCSFSYNKRSIFCNILDWPICLSLKPLLTLAEALVVSH